MKKNELIRRSFEFELSAEQDEEKGDIIVGRPIVYGAKADIGGYFAEIIERGALDSTDLTDVRFLLNHDKSKVLARSRKNTANSTMKLAVDAEGLGVRVVLDTENNADARSLYSAVKRGDISGMSFLFIIGDEEWADLDTDYPTRHVRSISTLIEVSAVAFPAYDDTTISARDKSAVETARQAVETARKMSVDTDKNKLELAKLKVKYFS